MVIEGSISITSNGAANVITLPSSDLTIVGFTHDDYYLSVPLGPGKNAIVPPMGPGGPRILPVTFKPGTNSITISSPQSGKVIVVYYGTPLAGAKNLTDLTGIALPVTTVTAAGSGSVQAVFPKSGTITGWSGYVSAGYAQFSWNTATGKVLTIYDEDTEQLGVVNITPLNIPTGDSFTLNYTASTALTFSVILYYR
jgi:hypothetical protein